ncbi:MAG: hypothetical protein WCH65_06120 [bacterium]
MMPIENEDSERDDEETSEGSDDSVVVVSEGLILEILILVTLCEEFLVVDLDDDPEEKVANEEKIFRWR